MLVCLECCAEWQADEELEKGEIIICPECGLEMEVIEIEPLQLAEAPEEEEDWGE